MSSALIALVFPKLSWAETPSVPQPRSTSPEPTLTSTAETVTSTSPNSASQNVQDLQPANLEVRSVENIADAAHLFGAAPQAINPQIHAEEINAIETPAISPEVSFSPLTMSGTEHPFSDASSERRLSEVLAAGFQNATLLADAPNDPEGDEAGDRSNKWDPGRPDSHAPIGVMGDHTHSKGEVMLSYRYMRMGMSGNLDGRNNLTPEEVLADFQITPLRMTTEMHMFGAMYAPTDELTLMVMAPYVIKSMDHLTRMGTNFTTNSEGFGDIRLSGLYKIFDRSNQRIHFNAGISFPTGSISEKDTTPAGPNQVLPYPMQTGAGTFNLMPGITYLGQAGNWSWGGQGMGTIRLGRNVQEYRLGNQLSLTAWGARKWSKSISTSLRLKGRILGNNVGEDPRLAPGNLLEPPLIPTIDPDLRGGSRVDLSVGLNFLAQKGFLKGHRFALEAGLPIFQSLSGPQLENDFTITVGWQKAFKP
ncbi:MAG: transporter [Cyanobacteria bacterium P01_A01_bin.17]